VEVIAVANSFASMDIDEKRKQASTNTCLKELP
jgi:hypothetical protein